MQVAVRPYLVAGAVLATASLVAVTRVASKTARLSILGIRTRLIGIGAPKCIHSRTAQRQLDRVRECLRPRSAHGRLKFVREPLSI
jgi:hypothetical protein